ncbi:oleate hydratase [Burkholderia sp. D7]|nr:oleate hydratase [Burkholderia sp. D7]
MRRAHSNPNGVATDDSKFYLVGGGIASLAAAAFLIRDVDIPGRNITIIEALGVEGGSLDAAGSPQDGYVLRGGRMLESKYVCTFDLFSSIPALDDSTTVTQEIFDWNETMKTSSKSRLVRNGRRIDKPAFGLDEKHILTLERLAIEPEHMLGRSRIADHFGPDFFNTNFWLMWCTTFAFQPWHSAVEFKRYLLRFIHMVSGFDELRGIMRTVYNQYDSMVRPLRRWLAERGVHIQLGTRVTDLTLIENEGQTRVTGIVWERGGRSESISLGPDDFAIVTLGSMTESSSLGGMDRAAVQIDEPCSGAWTLWDKIAQDRPAFGRPAVFANHVHESKWLSFTTTLNDPAFFNLLRNFTGNAPGEGGLITFADSSWLLSIVLPHQPHFISQPDDIQVFWGYGLYVDLPGDFVKKPMIACTGREIMTEILGHLRAETTPTEKASQLLDHAVCIPCLMPFITSQFLPRERGDRPDVLPKGSVNLAFTGQFCELPDDVVFTVEYSIRSAQTAVYRLLGIDRTPLPVYQGKFDRHVLFEAFEALHGR